MKKLLKIIGFLIGGVLLFILMAFMFLFLSVNTELPTGETGPTADVFAYKMLDAVKYEEFKKTRYISWQFANHNYHWDRVQQMVTVFWDGYTVSLNLNDTKNSTVYYKKDVIKKKKDKYIAKAFDYFNNDSFWLLAPYKLFDKGVKRELITLSDDSKALLVTYNAGGSTPGDSYLWKVDQNYLPTGFQMWTSIIPIGGLEASCENWSTTKSGAYIANDHRVLGFGIPISQIRAWND